MRIKDMEYLILIYGLLDEVLGARLNSGFQLGLGSDG